MTEAPAERKGGWIRTYSGRMFWPLDPRSEEVEIMDIAHALSLICRFGGHVRKFYSVAQHSVIVAGLVSPENRAAGLLHDAAEAYLADVSAPIKPHFTEFRAAEERLERSIAIKFGLPMALIAEIHEWDARLCLAEAQQLLDADTSDWECKLPPAEIEITPMTPRGAERAFLKLWIDLLTEDSTNVMR